MCEAILSRADAKTRSDNISIFESNMKIEFITYNTNWTVPESKNQEFLVRIFGGGRYGKYGKGGDRSVEVLQKTSSTIRNLYGGDEVEDMDLVEMNLI